MQVFTARTCEGFDIDHLCEELAQQIRDNVRFGSRTMGIAMCDSTIDYKAVMKKLSSMFEFDIYGATALAFIRINTEEDITVSFMIITGDEELIGSMALSEPMTPENKEQVILDAYHLAASRLGERPKMLITLQPYSIDITPDYTTEVLDRASGQCPIYGAVSSSDLESDTSGVFVNGAFYPDRLLINMLGGGIRPVFAVGQALFDPPLEAPRITKAEKNVVYQVGEQTFLDYMTKNGLIIDRGGDVGSCIALYAASPVMVFPSGQADACKLRNIIDIDFETGAVSFSGEMPQGHCVAICVLSNDRIEQSTKACFNDLIRQIEANTSEAYRYSTLFSTSCGGRYLVMSGDTSMEGDFITRTPALRDLASCGFYAMGEICPTKVENGVAENHAMHSSITLMAL